MSLPGLRRRVATLDIDASSGEISRVERAGAADEASLELGQADVWDLVLSLEGRPSARLVVPDPGAGGEGALRAAVFAACRAERSRDVAARSLRVRMGAPTPVWPVPTASVIVCTRGRPSSLAGLLDALADLDPAPSEIVLVDNAPPAGADCRDLARNAGALYVREDAPGLNRARRAGIAAATGELLAFTDDDCLPPRRWLSVLPELFANSNVGAVAGPAFPAALDTRAERRFERAASFSRGLARADLDFMVLSPPLATRAGAGANMVVRRTLLDRLGDVFPAELDAGTRTQSGGDAYALFRFLAAGSRVVYDPRLYTYHRHRSDPRRLHDAIRGYGVGLGALAAKLLIEDREPDALRIFGWLASQYLRTVAGGLAGARDPVEVRLAWDYLRGGLAGPGAWRGSRRRSDNSSPEPAPKGEHAHPAPPPDRANSRAKGMPGISVVVITHRPGELPTQCLAALARQTGAPPFETILVDDSPSGTTGEIRIPRDLEVRLIRTAGLGAAAARNAGSEAAQGELLIFLDDDLVPAPDLVATHWERHRDGAGERAVVGYSPPRPREANLVALSASLWWEDHFRARAEESASTFTAMLSGNVSVARATFERIGRFDAEFGILRREDWEWGIRALTAGVGIAYESQAVAEHRFRLDTRARLEAARAEGAGDALLARRHPFALASLPGSAPPFLSRARERLAYRLLIDDHRRSRAVRALDALERTRLRPAWARWFAVAQRAAYEAGFRSGCGPSGRAGAPQAMIVEVCSDEPIAPPRVAARALELELAGRPAGRVTPVDGQWTAALAERAARRLPQALLEQPGTHLDPTPGPASASRAAILGAPRREGRAARWESIRRQAVACHEEYLFIPVGGTEISAQIVERVTPLLAGERVALVLGGALELGRFPGPTLFSRATMQERFPLVGTPTRYLAMRNDAYRALGGVDPEAAAFGETGPVLELLDRALESGWTVGHCDVPAPAPRGIAHRLRTAELERWRARGGLLRDRARTHGLRWWLANGVAPVLARVLRAARPGGPRLRGAVGTALAFFVGSAARK